MRNPLWLPPSKWYIGRAKTKPAANPRHIDNQLVRLLMRARLMVRLTAPKC